MNVEDATRILADNLAERVVIRVANHEGTSLPRIIADEVERMLLRIADKQGWIEWPRHQIRN
jgi:hypothetical protein